MSFQKEFDIPKSLSFDMPPEIDPQVSSRYVSVAPSGITQTSSVSLPNPSFTTNSGMAYTPATPQQITFDIPTGNAGSFLVTEDTSLSFRLVMSVTTASSVAGGYMNIVSSAASFISQMQLLHNGQSLENMPNYDQLFHLLLNSTLSLSGRQSNHHLLIDSNSATGIEIAHAATGTYYYNACIPISSIIGINGGGKLFPIGSISNLQLALQTFSAIPFATYCTGTTTQPVGSFYIDNWNLNLKYVDLPNEMSRGIAANLKNGKIFLKQQVWTSTSQSIPSGSSGSLTIPINIRSSSVKSVITSFSNNSSPTTMPNYWADSINIGIVGAQLQNAGTNFRTPIRSLNPTARPAESWSLFCNAFNFQNTNFGGVINGEMYHMITSLVSGGDSRYVAAAGNAVRTMYSGNDANTPYATMLQIVKFPNSFYLGFDCERINSSLYSGQDTRNCPMSLDIQLATSTSSSYNATFHVLLDVVTEIDLMTKTIIVHQ